MRYLLISGLILFSTSCTYGQDKCSGASEIQTHIYHPQRLVQKKGCITVTGVIMKKLQEKDGDWHIRLKLDGGQDSDLLNDVNRSRQGGFLVFEPICINKVTQKDALKACANWHQQIMIPPIGAHVSVTGIHVLDKEHGWNELHPVTSIKIIQ